MGVMRIVTSNFIINTAFVAWFSAQIIKLILTLLLTRRMQWERMLGAGGMPSSHSALVCSMVVATARKAGISSPVFGVAFCIAAIVIYDAMGIRRAAGEQAKVLNKMIFEFPFFKKMRVGEQEQEAQEQTLAETDGEQSITLIPKELKELLGHTPFEVLGGCMTGILIAFFMPMT